MIKYRSNEPRLFRRADVFFWLLAVVVCGWLFLRNTGDEASVAVLQINGKAEYQINLHKNGPFELSGQQLPVEIVVIDGGVRIQRSKCPRQICVNQGIIKRPGEMIICVPYRILIYIPALQKNEQNNPTIITG